MSYYLDNYAFREQLIHHLPNDDLGIVVVIPCCNELELLQSLESLKKCDQPHCSVEVIVVINASEEASKSVIKCNQNTFEETSEWIANNENDQLKFYLIEENQLPKKHAGVGLARKIGMDEAVRRFEQVGNESGIIACFDADASCENNYLVELEKHFKNHPTSPACSIHFEHPITGTDFPKNIYNGIIQYELHLRYYKNGMAYAGFPYAYHTIGSSMAVRNDAYQKQNGMNKRKAGEDFYFLQKLIPLGGFTELKTTMIIPSPRVSDRVPFGTGRAMQNWLAADKQELTSYHPNSFVELKQLCEQVSNLYIEDVSLPESVTTYLRSINFEENLLKLRGNSTSKEHFTKLFFNWFNAFKVLKYMHFARDNYYPDVLITDVANKLLNHLNQTKYFTAKELLEKYRQMDLS